MKTIIGAYSLFRKGKRLDSFLKSGKVLCQTASKSPYMLYYKNSEIPTLLDIKDVGNQIKLDIIEIDDEKVQAWIKKYNLKEGLIKTCDNKYQEVCTYFSKDMDLSLSILSQGMRSE